MPRPGLEPERLNYIIYIGVLHSEERDIDFLGNGLVVGLTRRGASVLLYAHLPQDEFVNK